MAEGKPAETLARWQVSGLGRPGDTFTLELEERDKVVAKVECSLPATVDDDELIESVGVQLNHQLPVGYSIVLPTKEPSESKSAISQPTNHATCSAPHRGQRALTTNLTSLSCAPSLEVHGSAACQTAAQVRPKGARSSCSVLVIG